MRHLIITVVLLLGGANIASADQQVTLEWLAGNCSDSFRIYKHNLFGWVKVAEVTDTKISMVVPNSDVRWRVSGVCLSGTNQGEWWLDQGVWTGSNVSKNVKKQ
jgi:hypothetical protein